MRNAFQHACRIGSSPLAAYYTSAVLLANIYVCLRGNQVSKKFGLRPPTRRIYERKMNTETRTFSFTIVSEVRFPQGEKVTTTKFLCVNLDEDKRHFSTRANIRFHSCLS